jgi:DNA polymerase-3 subunit alpha
MEKESIGIYVSGHPIERFGSYARLNGFSQVIEVLGEKFKDGDSVSIIAMLISKKQFITKAGKTMCFTEFEDQTGKTEGIIFADLYEREAANLHTGGIYIIHGTISTKEEEDAKIIVKSLQNAENMQTNQEKPKNTLFINVDSADTDKIMQITAILRKYPGAQNVRICFSDTRTVTAPGGIGGVNITKDLLAELEYLCGQTNIKLK